MRCEVTIVGAGLSGLWLANALVQRGQTVVLLEARERVGGRILSCAAGDERYDLGPTWFWPGQPRMAKLADVLGVQVFEQHSAGALRYEHRDHRLQTHDLATMAGSYRVVGGMASLTDALARALPPGTLRLACPVDTLCTTDDGFTVRGDFGEVQSTSVVVAVPPRIVARTIRFEPALPIEAARELATMPTWMASHAKVVAIYDEPFWRDAGLSGDGISQRGPLAEIHDASPLSGRTGALFGFAAKKVEDEPVQLRADAVEQLARMFGPRAATPIEVLMQNWAEERFTATEADEMLPDHPAYGPPPALRALGPEGLVFAASEMGLTYGGYLEGALEAAEAALVWL